MSSTMGVKEKEINDNGLSCPELPEQQGYGTVAIETTVTEKYQSWHTKEFRGVYAGSTGTVSREYEHTCSGCDFKTTDKKEMIEHFIKDICIICGCKDDTGEICSDCGKFHCFDDLPAGGRGCVHADI